VIPTDALQLAASVGFLILGTRLILRSRGDGTTEPEPDPGDAPPTA
jgi:hypothetical protein